MPCGLTIPVVIKIKTKRNNSMDKLIRKVNALAVFFDEVSSLCLTRWYNAVPKLEIINRNAIIRIVLIITIRCVQETLTAILGYSNQISNSLKLKGI